MFKNNLVLKGTLHLIHCLQETPSSFSVFDEPIRTTSAVESFNAQLGRNFHHHGNFFRFVSNLKDVCAVQTHDMKYLIDGKEPTVRKTNKDLRIETNTDKLKKNIITPTQFLQILTANKEEDEEVMVSVADDGTDGEADEEDTTAINTINTPEEIECIVCYTRRPNVLFLPCRHLKCCLECVNVIEADISTTFACPYCRTPVTDKHTAFI